MFVRRCVALHGIAISAVGALLNAIFYKPLTKALDGAIITSRTNKVGRVNAWIKLSD